MTCEPEQHSEQGIAADCARHTDDEGARFDEAGGHPDDGAYDTEHEGDEQDEEVQDEERIIQDAVVDIGFAAELLIEAEIDLKKVHHKKSGDESPQNIVRTHHEERPQKYAEEQGHAELVVACDVEH